MKKINQKEKSREDLTIYVEKLDWDTDFFGVEVGRVNINSHENKISFKNCQPEFLYLFSENPINLMDFIKGYQGFLADEKVIFEKRLTKNVEIPQEIEETNLISTDLLQLAIHSGQYSRFKQDVNISNEKFTDLYSQWLTNSLSGSIADKVFVFRSNNKDVGFITVKRGANGSQIGLIAVSDNAKRMGIGKKLMQAAESWSYEEGMNLLNVVTQKNNTNACDFYKSLNYNISSTEYVYHFWKINETDQSLKIC